MYNNIQIVLFFLPDAGLVDDYSLIKHLKLRSFKGKRLFTFIKLAWKVLK